MFVRVALGAFLGAADYVEATRRRRELCVEFARALSGVDVAVAANATGPAPRIEAVPLFGVYERASYTGPYNLTGSPALSLPIGFEDGLPLAFQIVGKAFDEARVMRVGHAFEQATEFHRQRPPIAATLPSRG
jgi:aspartyl-tRNA(Asn)/glutamyl-tRNA(Gln) amidotransferase subunit A